MSRTRGSRVFAAGATLILTSWSQPVDACSYALGFDPPAVYCEKTGAIPSNAIVTADELGGLEDPSRFEPDGALVERLAPCGSERSALHGDLRCVMSADAAATAPLYRLRGAPAGSAVRSREQNPYSCPLAVTVEATPDETRPARPVLADVVIGIKTDPADTGCYTCPDVDALTLFVTNVSDDRAPRRQMLLAIYAGRTAEEAAARATIDHLVPVFEASEIGVGPKRAIDPASGPAIAAQAYVGESVDRRRPIDQGLFRSGPLCIAVELMDRAGNLSPRSNAMCFDHTNVDDPNVRAEEGSCACRTQRAPPMGTAFVALATLGLFFGLRRLATRARR